MYSMAVLNLANLPDLGQGKEFTSYPPSTQINERKGEKGTGRIWGQGTHEAWLGEGRMCSWVGQCGINSRIYSWN